LRSALALHERIVVRAHPLQVADQKATHEVRLRGEASGDDEDSRLVDTAIGRAAAPRLPGHCRAPLDRCAQQRLDDDRPVDRAVAEGYHHVGKAKHRCVDLADAYAAPGERLGELRLRTAPLRGDRHASTAQVGDLAHLAALRQVATQDELGKLESRTREALIRYRLDADAALDGVEQRGAHRAAGDVQVAGGQWSDGVRAALE